jgi:hypothetical protein
VLDEVLLPGWKAGLGYLPQDPFFIDGTLRENLVWDSGGGGGSGRDGGIDQVSDAGGDQVRDIRKCVPVSMGVWAAGVFCAFLSFWNRKTGVGGMGRMV